MPPPSIQPGKIIFLNGTSSSGKTTLSHALQVCLQEPYQHIALDQFRDGLPARYRGLNSPEGTPGALGLNVVPRQQDGEDYTDIEFGSVGLTMLKGMRRAIATMAQCGNNIIVDDIIMNDDFLDDYLKVMRDLTVIFVGIRCPIDVLNKRELERPGRFPGTAVGHFHKAHGHGIYDIEVDTSRLTAAECAERIANIVKNGPAEKYGLKVGDAITSLDGEVFRNEDVLREFSGAIAAMKPLDEIVIGVKRAGGKVEDLKVILARHPGENLNAFPRNLHLMDERARENHFEMWLKKLDAKG